nr:MAG TPA: hypothetical protein [Caudoviricetes sp.]DAN85244.1 MAG TPA: hypothetical protein [Caudoviricetes sp.]
MNRDWRCRTRGYYNLNSHKSRENSGTTSMIQRLQRFSIEDERDEESLGECVRLSILPASLSRELFG